MRCAASGFGSPPPVDHHPPTPDHYAGFGHREGTTESEIREYLAAIPPSKFELRAEELDAIVAEGRELLRRQQIRAFLVLTVMAVPVAAAGLLTGLVL